MTTPNIHLLYAIWDAQYSVFLSFNSVHSVAMPAQLPQKSEESTGYSQDYIILIVSCHCVLEIEPRSSVRAGSTLNYWANSSSPWIFSYYKIVFWILCPILDYYTYVFGVYTATQHVRSDTTCEYQFSPSTTWSGRSNSGSPGLEASTPLTEPFSWPSLASFKEFVFS